ncbi:DHHA1 domain-containing protein, partial [Halomonas sp. 707D4]
HIVSEAGTAAGVRRIEAITGENALAYFKQQEATLGRLGARLKAKPEQVEARVESLFERNRSLEKELEQLKAKLASVAGSDMLGHAQEIAGVTLLATQLEGVSGKDLRGMLDQLKQKLGSGVILLAVADQAAGKVSLIAGVTDDLTDRVKAGELVNFVAAQVGGKGGGRADMAQAGGSRPEALPEALKGVPAWLENTLR